MELVRVIVLLLIISTVESSTVLPKLNPNPKLIVFSFDGFRYDYLDKGFGPNLEKARAPTLKKLWGQGVTTPYMIPQFTTKTFPNHQSIATGLFTEKHGIVENAVYDIALGAEASGYDDEVEFWVYDKTIVPLWVVNEKAGEGRVSGAQFPGSTQAYGEDSWIIKHPLGYNDSMPFKRRMDYAVDWLTHPENPANLVFMYFEEPDGQGHKFGPDSIEVKEAIENLDDMTAYFLDELTRLRIRSEVNLIFVSDHGMEKVKEKNKIPLASLIPPELRYKWRGGSPLLQIWPEVDAEEDAIFEALLEASKTKPFNVHRKHHLPKHWHYENERRISPLLIIADDGFAFDERWDGKEPKSARHEESTSGKHGYDINNPNMRAFFMAIGPAFGQGVVLEPFRNVDLFPLMCEVLGLDPPENDGHLEPVKGALRPKLNENSANSLHISLLLMTLMAAMVLG